ncbi:GntR family transcriptional regulator [Thermocatellispora tengchongensis]|uniref:GntR family transcriptional regulator n=1 Tax=Thermocatellispora tengchongensis TaxID=1073253 RepID=UPI003632FBDF
MRTLQRRYGVARGTVQKAIDALQREGVIQFVPSPGFVVRGRARSARYGVERHVRGQGPEPEARATLLAGPGTHSHAARQAVREPAEVPAPEPVAERLNVPPGTPVWLRSGTGYVGNRPTRLADSYHPLDLVAGTAIQQEDTGPGGSFAVLESAGLRLAEVREEVCARMPCRRESIALALPTGTPVMELVRTVFDDTGRAVEVMIAVLAGDTTVFDYRFPIPD